MVMIMMVSIKLQLLCTDYDDVNDNDAYGDEYDDECHSNKDNHDIYCDDHDDIDEIAAPADNNDPNCDDIICSSSAQYLALIIMMIW